MVLRQLYFGVLLGFISIFIDTEILAFQPDGEEWNSIIKEKVPVARRQLRTYKEIYGAHAQGKSNAAFTEEVKGLDVPLRWLYANAYQRLHAFEKENSENIEKLTERPTEALKRLYLEHTQESKPLSIVTYNNYVMDVVELMDLFFHPGDEYLWKKSVAEIFSQRNNFATADSFFSPVFLKRQGISIRSINYAYFGETPFLTVVEVGPNRNAHERLWDQEKIPFIRGH